MEQRIEIPYQELPADTLRAVIEAFVLHEGTNYGDRDVSLKAMVDQVQRQLEKGQVKLVFDPELDSCNLIAAKEWREATG